MSSGSRGEVVQELWLVCANAGLGAARDLAVDRQHTALQLSPIAAVAVRYTSVSELEIIQSGGLCPDCIPIRPNTHIFLKCGFKMV
jgi:hypothetical protein